MESVNATPQPQNPTNTAPIPETNPQPNAESLANSTPIVNDQNIQNQNLPNFDTKNSVVMLSNSNPNILNSNIQNSLGYSHPLYPGLECYKMNKIYIICRLPGREVKIKSLCDADRIVDIEPFITPDSLDEFEIFNSYGQLINNFIYKKFRDLFNTKLTIYLTFRRFCMFYLEDIRKYISRTTFLYGNINFDKPGYFGIFVFNKKDNSTISVEYSTFFYQIMQRVNQFSSFCNALNRLYISGGELANGIITDVFICIDLSTVQTNSFFPIQLANLKKRRYWHSMIFIPERFIFIVGGSNTKEVEIYDMKRNMTGIDSYLITERCEPSLILVNSKFLYAFCGFHLYETFINSIERCNLHKRRRTWEIVNYKLENCPGLITAFYGVTYIGNDILLVSDRETVNDFKPNYILKTGRDGNDVIKQEGVLDSRSCRLFSEKFFLPYSDSESISLPFKSGEPRMFMVNNNTGRINELCLKESW